jgi:1,4-alpha-glucan branching enzyme
MLYLDYSRLDGEWIPNRYGGRENLEAVSFLRELNIGLYGYHEGIQTMAEDSTAWPGVSRPTDFGGLGFGYKWDMGWMHDTLSYMHRDAIHRRHHHDELTFRGVYAYSENYVLPLSHDEVVHGKGALVAAMPGDDWQRFSNLRLLFGYQYCLPGKKLLFMGSEIAQWREWSHERSLDWDLLAYAPHQGMQRFVGDLNRLYRSEPALFELDSDPSGFTWIEGGDADNSTLSFLRRAVDGRALFVLCNFTPVVRTMTLGLPFAGEWHEALNSDDLAYGGSGVANSDPVIASLGEWGGQPFRAEIIAPPLAVIVLRHEDGSHRDAASP